jgi:hypothetical protein
MIKNDLPAFERVVAKGQVILACRRFSHSTFRLSTFGLLLTFNFSFLTIQCGLDVEDPTHPSAPVWVQKSLPEAWPERGIDAHESGGIFLEWEPNLQDNIAAYLLYRAQYFDLEDSIGSYDQTYRLDMGENNELSFLDSDVRVNTQYFYALKAEDVSSNVSEFSDTLDYTLQPRINLAMMSPNGLSDTLGLDRALSWRYSYQVAMEDYSLTIVDPLGDLIFRDRFSPGNYVSRAESRMIPYSILFQGGQTYRWRIDTGAQYTDQLERSGSESPWATFLYAGE